MSSEITGSASQGFCFQIPGKETPIGSAWVRSPPLAQADVSGGGGCHMGHGLSLSEQSESGVDFLVPFLRDTFCLLSSFRAYSGERDLL